MVQYSKKTIVYGILSAALFIVSVFVIYGNLTSYRDSWSPVVFLGFRENTLWHWGPVVLAPLVFLFGHIFKKRALKERRKDTTSEFLYIAWFVNMSAALMLLISVVAHPVVYCSRLSTQDQAAVANVILLVKSCDTFKSEKYGLSDKLDKQYLGYPRQTEDLYNAEIETDAGPEKIKEVYRAICANEGEDGYSGGFVFRYIVLKKSKDGKSGLMQIDEYMICAYPEVPGRTGTSVIIGSSSGKIYRRVLDYIETRDEMFITEWPSEEELKKNWKLVPR